ncbi:helix-turn-helix domain-containing protein [Yinghuangia soli]|uniref:helix-turn-helix domain-containing protein n=1 Tax=Yinghuangia soli TaxID=2908204 RepID=UPI003557272C
MAIRQGGGSPAPGNVRLKALRHAKGWVSQQQLADAFEKKALECGLRLAVSVRQVRRWESAEPPWPTPDYQKVLQELFGRPLTDLGFTPPWQAELDATGGTPPEPAGGFGAAGEPGGVGPVGGNGGPVGGNGGPGGPGGQSGYGPPGGRAYGPLNGAADAPRPPGGRQGYRFVPRAHRMGTEGRNAGTDGREPPGQVVLPRGAAPPQRSIPAAPGLMPEPAHFVEPRGDLDGLVPPSRRSSGLILPGQGPPRAVHDLRVAPPALLRAGDRVGNGAGSDGLMNLADHIPGPGRDGRLGSAVADQYARLTASYRQMYWVAPAGMTYRPVVNHVIFGDQLLKAPGPGRPRRVLAASVAETAMLAGRIAFFDLGDEGVAKTFYKLADQAAYDAQEPLLRQAVFAHRAFMPAFAGRPGEARALVERANNPGLLADIGAPALMRSWLCAVNAEIESLIGDKDRALHLMDRAEDFLAHQDDLEVPAWLDFFDSARLWGFRGGAELAAKRYDAARDALTDALGDLPANAAKQQAVTCADLARVAAASGDLDEASGMLSRALDALTRQWYSLAMDRVKEVRLELEPFKNAACIRRLDEELVTWKHLGPAEEDMEQPELER